MAATLPRTLVLVALTAILVGGCAGSIASSAATASPSAAASEAPPPSAVASPSASPSPSSAGLIPPVPARTSFKHLKEVVAADGYTTTEYYRATWSEPTGAATKFDVYGVTDCLRSSQANDNTPCVIPGTKLPGSTLKRIGTVAGTARKMDVTWTIHDEVGLGPYQAVVIIARNSRGSSDPAVLWSAVVCFDCVI